MPDRLRDLRIDRVALVPAGDNPRAEIMLWKARREGDGDLWETVLKRTFTRARRVELARSGAAIPVRDDDGEIVDGRYPIETVADLRNAMQAIGRVRAGDRETVIRHIRKRARALGATSELSDTFKEDPRPSESRLARLLTRGGRKEETIVPEEKQKETTLELPDDLSEEARKAVEEAFAKAVEEAREGIREEVRAELEKADEEPEGDPLEKALADSELDPAIKAAIAETRTKAVEAEKRAADAEAEVQKQREAAEVAKAEKAVAEWRYLSVKPEEFGPVLAKVRETAPDQAAEIERVLTSANGVASEAMREIGKGESGTSEAIEKLDALAEAFRKEHPDLTKEQAFAQVAQTEEGRELRRQSVAEIKGGE